MIQNLYVQHDFLLAMEPDTGEWGGEWGEEGPEPEEIVDLTASMMENLKAGW